MDNDKQIHHVQNVRFSGTIMDLKCDGTEYIPNVASLSQRLAAATDKQRANFRVLPSGYDIHWPEVDEDLSVDGLIRAAQETAKEYDPAAVLKESPPN